MLPSSAQLGDAAASARATDTAGWGVDLWPGCWFDCISGLKAPPRIRVWAWLQLTERVSSSQANQIVRFRFVLAPNSCGLLIMWVTQPECIVFRFSESEHPSNKKK